MYYSGTRYWARCRGKARTTVNTTCTTKLWSGCLTDNSNYILRFTIINKLFMVGTGP